MAEEKKPHEKSIEAIYKNQEEFQKAVRTRLEDPTIAVGRLYEKKREIENSGGSLSDNKNGEMLTKTFFNTLAKYGKEWYGITGMDKDKEIELTQDRYGVDKHDFLIQGLSNNFSMEGFLEKLLSAENKKQIAQKYQSGLWRDINPEHQTDMLDYAGLNKYLDTKTIGSQPQNLPLTTQLILNWDKGKGDTSVNTLKGMGLAEYLKPEYKN